MSHEIAIIMGNGPSLNDMPSSFVKAFDTYGCNYAKFQPKYYVCIDEDLLKNPPPEVLQLARRAETTYLSGYVSKDYPNLYTYQLYSLPNVELVSGERRGGGAFQNEDWMTGGTATYVSLKLAFYAGYDEIWLWGVDHTPGWEHYSEDYPEPVLKGAERESHMKMMLKHYRLAERVYRAHGRRILNFGAPGPLDEIFDRGRWEGHNVEKIARELSLR